MRLLAPIPADRRPRRFVQLLAGLLLYGATMGMMVRGVLGLDPWDVFHQGVTAWVNQWIPLSYGAVITLVSVVVLLLWIPLRQRPGIGTIANAAIIGFTTDATLAVLPTFTNLPARIALMTVAIVGNAVAGALYIGAGLGPGPRDGLMTGLVARGVGSIRVVRTTIELTVLAIGWVLGGVVGVGTVLYALAIGPLLHLLLPRLTVKSAAAQSFVADRVPETVAAGTSGDGVGSAASGTAADGEPIGQQHTEFHDPVAVDPEQIWEGR
jgi:uncharacterized membrane protein YczE